jgi:hypothetical protein
MTDTGAGATGHGNPGSSHSEQGTNEHVAVLIERSSLGTQEGRLRRSTVPSATGRAIARSAIARSASTGRHVTAASAARPRTTVTERGGELGSENSPARKGSPPSDDL